MTGEIVVFAPARRDCINLLFYFGSGPSFWPQPDNSSTAAKGYFTVSSVFRIHLTRTQSNRINYAAARSELRL